MYFLKFSRFMALVLGQIFQKKANTIRTGLKQMEVTIETEEKNNPNAGAQLRMKKTQHMAVSKTFIEMMTEYNKIQTDFR